MSKVLAVLILLALTGCDALAQGISATLADSYRQSDCDGDCFKKWFGKTDAEKADEKLAAKNAQANPAPH